MSALDLDALRVACENTARAQSAFRAADLAGSGHVAAASVLMEACADLSTHVPTIMDSITRLRAAESRTAWNYDLNAAPTQWCLACAGEIVYKAAPCGDEWVEVGGRTIKPCCWMPLPAAPEAP